MYFALILGLVVYSLQLTTITVKYPQSNLPSVHSLFIRGDEEPFSWDSGIRLVHNETDTWTYTFTPKHASYEVKILIQDTTWSVGRNLIVDSSEPDTLTPYFEEQPGTWWFSSEGIYSPQLDNTRFYSVYLPSVWYENQYSVIKDLLVMHDGNNLFTPGIKPSHRCPDQSCAPFGSWEIDTVMDQLIIDGSVPPVAVLGLFNTPDRDYEYTYSYDSEEQEGGWGDLYLDFLRDTAMPRAGRCLGDASRLDALPSHTVLMGSSLGGLISAYAGVNRTDLPMCGFGCMSSSFWWNEEDFLSDIIPPSTQGACRRVWLDSGDSGDGRDDEFETLRVLHALEGKGWTYGDDLGYYLDQGGTHDEATWSKRVWRPIEYFFG